MATSVMVGVAEAIKTSLNKGTYIGENGTVQTFILQFVAKRVYVTDWKRELEGIKVVVMPKSQIHEVIARGNETQDTIRIQIGIQGEARPDELAKSDDLMKLVEEIKTHIKTERIPFLEDENITLIGIEHDPIWDPEHLIEQKQFRTAPTFVFREIRL